MGGYFRLYKFLNNPITAVIVLLFMLLSCKPEKQPSSAKVTIKESRGKYTLYRNGKPYVIKGGAGYTNFWALKNAGGNTMRIWDTVHLARILDSAQANHLAVIVGLPIANSDYMALYDDPARVAKQFNAFKRIVNRFKAHPAVLMWCIGNELDFPYKLSYNSFYRAFNQLTDMIHKDDPDHPVTTTLLNFNRKYIFNLKFRCDIDVISFNIFSRITVLREDLKEVSLFWKGPYMLAEWGINGPWQGTEQTAWGAYIEKTSNKKAELYLNRYQKYVPVEDSRFLGAFVFYWGNKQEGTPTWFSMFDAGGAKSEAVDVMRYVWTGKSYKGTFPQIKDMLLDKKVANDNIFLSPGLQSVAELKMLDKNTIRSVKWEILKEDWFKKNNIHNSKKLKPLQTVIKYGGDLKMDFIAPAGEGPYRIYATVYDNNQHFSTCNIPFYVVAPK